MEFKHFVWEVFTHLEFDNIMRTLGVHFENPSPAFINSKCLSVLVLEC